MASNKVAAIASAHTKLHASCRRTYHVRISDAGYKGHVPAGNDFDDDAGGTELARRTGLVLGTGFPLALRKGCGITDGSRSPTDEAGNAAFLPTHNVRRARSGGDTSHHKLSAGQL